VVGHERLEGRARHHLEELRKPTYFHAPKQHG
jgi:hypothetical protein